MGGSQKPKLIPKTLPNIWLNHGLKLTIFKGTRPRRNKKERICKIKEAEKKVYYKRCENGKSIHFLKNYLIKDQSIYFFFFKFSSANLMIMYRCSVIFVTNSCGESWDSSS